MRALRLLLLATILSLAPRAGHAQVLPVDPTGDCHPDSTGEALAQTARAIVPTAPTAAEVIRWMLGSWRIALFPAGTEVRTPVLSRRDDLGLPRRK